MISNGTAKVQRVNASAEFSAPVSSSSLSSSSPSVDGIGVEAEADGLELLGDGNVHLLGRVAGFRDSVLGII
jgi:hypothetical protein